MYSLSSLDIVYIALIFIVPGFIIKSIRAQFIIEQDRTGVDQGVRLLAYSAINFAIFGSILYTIIPYSVLSSHKFLLWSFMILVAPSMAGILSGASSQKQLLYKLLNLIGLRPIHVVPNAWDFKFAQAGGEFVCVTLKDDVRIAGWWSGDSFASSDGKERDVLIGQVYKMDGDKPWEPTNRSVLIAAGDIKRVEFQKPEP